MSLVAIEGVHKRFGTVEVLKGVGLTVAAGEVVALLGRSGSGKTTLLRCINGLETISAGSIRVCDVGVGESRSRLRELRLKAGMIFQQFNLFPHLTAGRNVMLAQQVVRRKTVSEARDTAQALLSRVGLGQKFHHYPHELSGGQQQRVAIARALAMEPAVLLCDEITSALDPELVGEVLAVVRQLAADGITVIMVTHEIGFARDVCDRAIFMHDGKIHESNAPEQLFKFPQTEELKRFLGQLDLD